MKELFHVVHVLEALWGLFPLSAIPLACVGILLDLVCATWDPQCYVLLEGLDDTLMWEHVAQKWPRNAAPCTGSITVISCQSYFCAVDKLVQHGCQKENIGTLESSWLNSPDALYFLEKCVNQDSSEVNRSHAGSSHSASRPPGRIIFKM